MSWRVGDAIVLLEPAGLVHNEAALADVLAMLDRRRFLRSAPARIHGNLREELTRLCSERNCGCRVSAEDGFVHGAIVTCAPHAHLALSVVAEREGNFRAECLGSVTAEGVSVQTYRVV
jgi:hypothetical protein